MSKSKQIPLEVQKILSSLPIDFLEGLTKIHTNEQIRESLKGSLNMIHTMDKDHIVRGAGGVTSMDTMINAAVDESFYRGRISFATLLNIIISYAPEFFEKRLELAKKKPVPYGKAR